MTSFSERACLCVRVAAVVLHGAGAGGLCPSPSGGAPASLGSRRSHLKNHNNSEDTSNSSCMSTEQLQLFKYTSFDRKEVFESMVLVHQMNIQNPAECDRSRTPRCSSCCTTVLDPWGQDPLLTDTKRLFTFMFCCLFFTPKVKDVDDIPRRMQEKTSSAGGDWTPGSQRSLCTEKRAGFSSAGLGTSLHVSLEHRLLCSQPLLA